jgi:hypothetical protein
VGGEADQLDPKPAFGGLAKQPLLPRLKQKGRPFTHEGRVISAKFLPERPDGINAVRAHCAINESWRGVGHDE